MFLILLIPRQNFHDPSGRTTMGHLAREPIHLAAESVCFIVEALHINYILLFNYDTIWPGLGFSIWVGNVLSGFRIISQQCSH